MGTLNSCKFNYLGSVDREIWKYVDKNKRYLPKSKRSNKKERVGNAEQFLLTDEQERRFEATVIFNWDAENSMDETCEQ